MPSEFDSEILPFVEQVNKELRLAKDASRSADRRRRLTRHLPGGLRYLDTASFRAAWESMKSEGATESSLKRTFAAFGPVLKRINEATGKSIMMPSFGVATRKRRDYLSREDWSLLYNALPTLERPVADFLLKTGMRLGEVFSLRLGDFVDVSVRLMDTKNGAPRFVPLPETTDIQHLLDYVCVPSNRERFQSAFRTAARKLFPGREIVVHTLRHTCASWLVEKDVPLSVVADYLGHKDLQTTRRYAHVATSTLRAAMTKVF